MNDLGFALTDIARLMRKRFDALRPGGLTGAQWRVLKAVAENPGINQGQLADRLEVEAITVCRMIDRMEQSGLLERRPDPHDRRTRRLYPVAEAAEVLAQLGEQGARFLEAMTTGLAPADRARLAALLAQVRANLLDDLLFSEGTLAHG